MSTPSVISSKKARKLLHVGCGPSTREQIPPVFAQLLGDDFQEVRFDINPDAKPDIIGDMRDLANVKNDSMDGLFSSHNIEHVFTHEVLPTLKNFYRVLKHDGIICIICPDIQSVAQKVAEGNLEGVLYHSPAGDITAQDILYGHIAAVQRGEIYMAHKTSFTAQTLADKLHGAGFSRINVYRHMDLSLIALARKLTNPKSQERVPQVHDLTAKGTDSKQELSFLQKLRVAFKK